jgi:hypothetical protein
MGVTAALLPGVVLVGPVAGVAHAPTKHSSIKRRTRIIRREV